MEQMCWKWREKDNWKDKTFDNSIYFYCPLLPSNWSWKDEWIMDREKKNVRKEVQLYGWDENVEREKKYKIMENVTSMQ